jgi:MFS family permease
VADRRVVVPALGLATALALLGDVFVYTVLPTQPGSAGLELAALGVMLSVHRFIRLAANPLGGLLYDRVGRRQPYLLGMTLAVASTGGYWVAVGFWPMLLARLCWGVAFALISVGGASIIFDLTTAADRGRAVGLYQAIMGAGTLFAFSASGVLADVLGYRGALAIYAPLTAVGWVVAFAAVAETRQGADLRPGTARDGSTEGWWAGLRALDRRLIAPVAVSFASFFACSGVLMSTLGLFLKTHAAGLAGGMPVASLTGILLAQRRLVLMLGAPLSGLASDRLASRRVVAAVGVVVGIGGFAVLASASALGTVVAGVALASLAEAFIQPATTAWVGDATPTERRGQVTGIFAAVNDLGGGLGPLAGYALAGRLGLGWAYAACAMVLASTLGVLASTRGRSGRRG